MFPSWRPQRGEDESPPPTNTQASRQLSSQPAIRPQQQQQQSGQEQHHDFLTAEERAMIHLALVRQQQETTTARRPPPPSILSPTRDPAPIQYASSLYSSTTSHLLAQEEEQEQIRRYNRLMGMILSSSSTPRAAGASPRPPEIQEAFLTRGQIHWPSQFLLPPRPPGRGATAAAATAHQQSAGAEDDEALARRADGPRYPHPAPQHGGGPRHPHHHHLLASSSSSSQIPGSLLHTTTTRSSLLLPPTGGASRFGHARTTAATGALLTHEQHPFLPVTRSGDDEPTTRIIPTLFGDSFRFGGLQQDLGQPSRRQEQRRTRTREEYKQPPPEESKDRGADETRRIQERRGEEPPGGETAEASEEDRSTLKKDEEEGDPGLGGAGGAVEREPQKKNKEDGAAGGRSATSDEGGITTYGELDSKTSNKNTLAGNNAATIGSDLMSAMVAQQQQQQELEEVDREQRGLVAAADRIKNERFPEKLHRLLREVEAEGKSDIISFSPNGQSFRIHKPDDFFRDIISKYFNQNHFSSFKRQLNLYEFEVVASGPDKGNYFHKFFVRDNPRLCRSIRRRDVKPKGTNASGIEDDVASPARNRQQSVRRPDDPTAPDFYSMPPIATNEEAAALARLRQALTGGMVGQEPAPQTSTRPRQQNNF